MTASWLVPAIVSTLSATLILAFLYGYLYRLNRDRYVGIWAIAWSIYAARFVFSLIDVTQGGVPVVWFAGQIAALTSGVVLFWGSHAFLERQMSRAWWWLTALIGGWLAIGTFTGLGEALGFGSFWTFAVTTGPNFWFLALVYILTGLAWLRADFSVRVGHRTTGVLFILWGIHKADFPFLRQIEWLAPWGYLIATTLTVAVAVAIVLVYFRNALIELEESRERYRSIFEGGHTMMLVFDATTGDILEANSALADFYGYSISELRRMNLTDLETMPEHELQEDLSAAVDRRLAGVFRHSHRTASGEIKTIEVHSGVQVVNGREVVLAIINDITDTIDTLIALRDSEERYAALFGGNRMVAVVVDPESLEIVEANPAAADFYGFEEGQLEGTSYVDLVELKEYELRDQIAHAVADERDIIEMRQSRADGALRDVEVQLGPLSVGGRTLMSLFVVDVTERNQAYTDLKRYRDNLEKIVEARTAELEKANRELTQASRAKSQFLAAMSHELRTPLNSIIGFTGILLQGLTGQLTDEQQHQIQMVNRSGKHLLELINAVLDLSKIEAGRAGLEVEEIDAVRVADSVLESVRPMGEEKGIELVLDTNESSCVAQTDGTKLRQIVLNLVGNALKFTDEGSVTVVLDCDEHRIRIDVVDTGPGIAERDLPHVFEEFTQLAPKGDIAKPAGTGLGLPVSLRLAKLLGGSIAAESDVGKGSTFTLTIPRDLGAVEGVTREQPARRAAEEARTGGKVVLIIDDDPSIHDLYRVYLGEEGVRIIHAYDLDTGMRLLRSHAVNAVILDLLFEDGSGWSLLRRMRDDPIFSGIPVIVSTVNDEREKGERYGAFAFLVKPVNREDLTSETRAALGED